MSSVVYSIIHSLIHSLTHSFAPSLSDSFIHSFIHNQLIVYSSNFYCQQIWTLLSKSSESVGRRVKGQGDTGQRVEPKRLAIDLENERS